MTPEEYRIAVLDLVQAQQTVIRFLKAGTLSEKHEPAVRYLGEATTTLDKLLATATPKERQAASVDLEAIVSMAAN